MNKEWPILGLLKHGIHTLVIWECTPKDDLAEAALRDWHCGEEIRLHDSIVIHWDPTYECDLVVGRKRDNRYHVLNTEGPGECFAISRYGAGKNEARHQLEPKSILWRMYGKKTGLLYLTNWPIENITKKDFQEKQKQGLDGAMITSHAAQWMPQWLSLEELKGAPVVLYYYMGHKEHYLRDRYLTPKLDQYFPILRYQHEQPRQL
jgi:hypothetical protein